MASDITAPLFHSISFSQSTIDMDNGETALIVTARFSDDLSGVFDGEFADGSGGSSPQICFVSSTGQIVDGIFDILNPVSGDQLDGVFQATITLGAFAEVGLWQAQYLLLNDEAGNTVTFEPDNSPLIANTSFTVINANSDTVAPTLQSISLSQTSLDIDNGETTLFCGCSSHRRLERGFRRPIC